MSFVKAGMIVPPRMLIAGIPARVVRPLTEQEIAWKSNGTVTYHDIAARSLATMTATEALTAVEPDRQRVRGRASTPLHKLKD
jgi:phenylacetic acid degradation protein